MKSKLEYLQIGRGLAALLIVLYHITETSQFYFHFMPLGGIFNIGWNGVDFFFVLSGFIIYYVHKNDIGNPGRFIYYCKKRLIRIYPIYWIIATVNLAVLYLFSKNITNNQLQIQMHDTVYLLKSYLLIFQQGFPFLGVAWSLCYEVAFYVVFGLAILFGRKIMAAFGITYLLCFLFLKFLPLGKSTLYMFVTSNYHIEFIIGVLAGVCFYRIDKITSPKINVGSMLRIFLISGLILFVITSACSFYLPDYFDYHSTTCRLCYGLASFLIILGVTRLKINSNNKFSLFLLSLGNASFVLYLAHPLILSVFFKVYTRLNLSNNMVLNYFICFLSLLVSVVIAIIIHKSIELNINNWLTKKLIKKKPANSVQ
jgi:exopolysaccharide production protein ExoZ